MVRFGGTEVSGFLIFLLLVNLYFLLLYILVKRGWLARMGMALFGPALMIKTERGRGILDFFARARGLFIAGVTVGTWFTATVMTLMSVLLIVQIPTIARTPVSQAPSPSLILGIPGVNPIIPLGYGVLALIFAVVVHEMSHGILARCYNLRVKTMGILFLVIPIGAFVEPDEEDMQKAPRKQRVRVFGAGPTSNLFFALVFGAIFSGVLMANAPPVDGLPIVGIEKGGPLDVAGVQPGAVVTELGGTPIRCYEDVRDVLQAGTTVRPNETTTLTFEKDGRPTRLDVTPVRRSELYTSEEQKAYIRENPERANDTVLGFVPYSSWCIVKDSLRHPLASGQNFLVYFSLPFLALQNQFPLAGAFEQFYATPFDSGTFWVLANTAYWLFWINLMLGLTNALPILPLDGGHMFRDYVGALIHRLRPNATPERRDAIVRRISLIVTLTLLSLVVFQFVGPYLLSPFQ